MKTPIALAAAAALAFGLTACGGGNTVTPAEPATAAAPVEPAAPAVKMSGAFGDTITFPGGVAVTASVPRVVTATTYAYGAVDGKIVVVELRVTNGGTEPFDAVLMGYPKFTYGPGGHTAQTAADMESGIGSGSFSTVLPGETQTTVLGYGVPAADLGAVRMEVNGPTYADAPAIFKGGAL